MGTYTIIAISLLAFASNDLEILRPTEAVKTVSSNNWDLTIIKCENCPPRSDLNNDLECLSCDPAEPVSQLETLETRKPKLAPPKITAANSGVRDFQNKITAEGVRDFQKINYCESCQVFHSDGEPVQTQPVRTIRTYRSPPVYYQPQTYYEPKRTIFKNRRGKVRRKVCANGSCWYE